MKKISQILLCAVVFAYISVICNSSHAEETIGRKMTGASGFYMFVKLGQQQAQSAREPVLSIEDNMAPVVGSTLTNIYQTVIEDPDTGSAHANASVLPEPMTGQTEKKAEKKKEKKVSYAEYILPARLGLRKSLESHTAITNRSSLQYRLQQKAATDELGLRKYKKRYMVAVGTYFNAPVGAKIDVYLSGGGKLKCIVGDIKSDLDTIGGLTQKDDGSVVEFIVEWRRVERNCKRIGSMHALEEFDGYVEKIIVYEENK